MIILNKCRHIPILAFSVTLVIGCSPMDEREKEYFEQQQAEWAIQDRVSKAIDGRTKHAEAIEMVKNAEAQDGKNTYAEWLEWMIRRQDGSVMFRPRWETEARGKDKFDVKVTYTLIDGSYHMKKMGYIWSADLVFQTVSEPRELTESDIVQRTRRQVSRQRERRERKETFSLE